MCKVTVILTSYNHAKYIKEAIDSVLAQTYQDYELIVWDDASSDESWDIIQSYKDEKIKAYRNEESKRGIYGANKAISEIAKGKYIAIHHSDDIWEPTKLEKQVKFLDENAEYGAVFTNALPIDEDSKLFTDTSHRYYSIFEQPNRTRYEWLNFFFYQGNALCHPSVLIRKDCFDYCGVYRYGLAQVGDYEMWIRLCQKYEIFVIPEKLTKFRFRDNEANSSGELPTNMIRAEIEFGYMFQSFRTIRTWDEFIKVFPNASKYYNKKGFVPEFVFAMMALEKQNSVKLLGLNILFEILNDVELSIKVKELYSFDYKSLIEINSQNDIFKIYAIKKLQDALSQTKQSLQTKENELTQTKQSLQTKENELTQTKQNLNQKSDELDNLKTELVNIYTSKSWKITKPLRDIMRKLRK